MSAPVQPASATTSGSATLPIASAGTLLSMVAFTDPLSTVPSLARSLHAGPAAQSWVLSSMSLGLAAALLVTGALGDDYGRRRMFVSGAAILAAGSLLSAVSPGAVLFVVGRLIQGLGAAAVVSCSLALISHAYPPGPGRTRASGMWGASLGAGIALGPVLGAGSEQVSHWRIGPIVVAGLTAVLAVAGRSRLAESTSGHSRPVDLAGSALLGTGLAALVAALTQGRQGWTRPSELALIVAAVVLLGAFLAHQRTARHAMLDLSLFGRPALRSTTIAAVVCGAGIIALMSFMCTMLERGLGRSPLAAALILVVWSATSVVTALLTRRLPARIPGFLRLSVSLVIIAAGMGALAELSTGSGLWLLVPGLLVAGAGSGLLNATLGREAVASVPAERAGMGSGINNTARYVGSAIGVTIVTVIAVRPSTHPQRDLVAGWNTAAIVCAAVSLVGGVVVWLCHRGEQRAA
jgi:MFS family permease